MRMLEREFDRAVTAHREAADSPLTARWQKRQGGLQVRQKVLKEIILAAFGTVEGIGVPAIAAVGKSNDYIIGSGIAGEAGVGRPVPIIAVASVQEHEQRKTCFAGFGWGQ